MATDKGVDVHIREAVETEAPQIVELYRAVYGTGYVYARFYDEREITRMVFDEDTLVLIAEDTASGRVVGSAAVLFTKGAYTDLVGEFGRLVVHPEFRGRRIGTRLMAERLSRVGGRLHVAFAEVRVHAPDSAQISQRHGFVPVGALPQKLAFGGTREHAAYLVRYFGDALALRKNHPRIIPEAHHLAVVALSNAGIEPDVVIDEDARAYPGNTSFDLKDLTAEGYTSLLRIERGRIRHREIFGPQRLHYGLFKLAASRSNYIVARDGARIVGAVGYTTTELEQTVRVFEVIHTAEEVIRHLFEALQERCEAQQTVNVEIDVSAHAPRMQRTLLEMGYLPCAYVPALAFDDVERVDVVKMYRLMGDLEDLPFDAPEPTLSVGQYVLGQFARRDVIPRLARAMDRLDICRGLTQEQTTRLLGEFTTGDIESGSEIFGQGASPERMVLIVDGHARVLIDGELVGSVGPGESLGEVSFMNNTPHSAAAVAQTDMEVGILTRERLDTLVRRRTDIGAIVYRNLAHGLGEKLRRADRRLTSKRPSSH
ncbi:MAG: GNAT family N-acetyltransferase [Gemmatimonadota bacterium]|nr:GNAT family N-acetyltransferase [Gemmatimonadota bacterium]